MVPKKKYNLTVPEPLVQLLEKGAKRVGGKEKWLVVGAAIVMFSEASENDQNRQIRRIAEASLPGGSWSKLVQQIQAAHAAASRPAPEYHGDQAPSDLTPVHSSHADAPPKPEQPPGRKASDDPSAEHRDQPK